VATTPAPAPAPAPVAPAEHHPAEPHRGALCFDGVGPTDIRAFDRSAIAIYERGEKIDAIGSCRIVARGGAASPSGFDELLIFAGPKIVATLTPCGGETDVRGIAMDGGPQVGDGTEALAGYPHLTCRADPPGYWCYEASVYDPIDTYFVTAPDLTAITGRYVTGLAAVQLVRGRTIERASFGTRCD